MNIGDEYLCIKDIKLNENHIFKSKYMIMKVGSIEKRNDKVYVRVYRNADIYEIISDLLLDENYFKLVRQ